MFEFMRKLTGTEEDSFWGFDIIATGLLCSGGAGNAGKLTFGFSAIEWGNIWIGSFKNGVLAIK